MKDKESKTQIASCVGFGSSGRLTQWPLDLNCIAELQESFAELQESFGLCPLAHTRGLTLLVSSRLQVHPWLNILISLLNVF